MLILYHSNVNYVFAGGFNVHCTQSAESVHKLCMHLASARVHHRDLSSTKSAMLRHLLLRYLFEDMQQLDTRPRLPPLRRLNLRTPPHGVRCELCRFDTAEKFTEQSFQEKFLHRQARIAKVELMDLLCDKFEMSRSLGSYERLEQFRYFMGQNLVRRDGMKLWSTGTKYPSNKRGKERGDILRIEGHERVGHTNNALCCEAIAFLTVTGLDHADFPIPQSVKNEVQVFQDSTKREVRHYAVIFVLGRWFTPHRTAVGRDSSYRPICPGPLHINHSLWKYARARQTRKSMITSSGVPTEAFSRQAHVFGESRSEQIETLNKEKHAYFALLFASNVVERVNMCPVFIPNTSQPDAQTWLQTINVV